MAAKNDSWSIEAITNWIVTSYIGRNGARSTGKDEDEARVWRLLDVLQPFAIVTGLSEPLIGGPGRNKGIWSSGTARAGHRTLV